MTVTLQTRLIRASDAVWRELEERMAIISLEEGRIRTLNPVGSLVWNAIDGRPLYAVLTLLCEEFPDQPVSTLQDDLLRFASELVTRGVVSVVPDPPV